MKRKVLLFALSCLAAGAMVLRAGEPENAANATLAFEKMKSLVRRWEAVTPEGKKVGVVYELVSGGAALLERFLAEGPEDTEMVTLYHLDGPQFMLTHYCMANNQPRMRARPYDPASRTIAFEFLDATNLADPNAGHMRRAIYQFLDDGSFTTEWTFRKDGKDAFTEALHFKRAGSRAGGGARPSAQNTKEKGQ
jgi:hypothetical protein